MLHQDEENNEKYNEYKKILEGLEFLFAEFQNINAQPEKREVEKKITKKKSTKSFLNTHEIYKSLLLSEHYKNKLTLLDEKQSLDESESFQKIIDLFLEDTETIPEIETKNGDPDKYILTQLFTAFSLFERKIYLTKDKNLDDKSRLFLKNLNRIKFTLESKLTPRMFEYFNHNILRIKDIYQSKEKIINNINSSKQNNEEQNNKKIRVIEAKEIKQLLKKVKKLNNLDSSDDNGNIILNDEIKEEGVQKVDSISYVKNYENIDLDNEEYKKMKSEHMRKILELENDKLKNITTGEFQEIIKEVYTNGNISNKELENKITEGKHKLFDDGYEENIIKVTNMFPNEIELSLNQEEKMENDEEIVDDKDIPDFEQEEIKNQQNKTLFFEKEDFEKEFFSNITIIFVI